MRRALFSLFVFILLLAAPFVVRYVGYYGFSFEKHIPPADYQLKGVPALVPTPAVTEFSDEPEVGQGAVLLDLAHENNFAMEEVGYLDARLAARGFDLVAYNDGDLANALRPVTAYVVIAPIRLFTTEEAQAVQQFVNQGGKLLLIGDPTRFTAEYVLDEFGYVIDVAIESDKIPLNSLANLFGIVFQGDYLYNTVQNEGNFRNIIVEDDGVVGDSLTEGVNKVVFYGSHSLQMEVGGKALFLGDKETWSSATDRPGGLILGGVAANGRVLAVGDIHFLSEPYATVYDNGRLIAGIADFLSQQERRYILTDFPYFFDQPVDLVYSDNPKLGPDAFDEIVALQEAFAAVGKTITLQAEPVEGHAQLYLGVYNQADDVEKLLEDAGITLRISPAILQPNPEATPDPEAEDEEQQDALRHIQSNLGNVQMSGSSLLVWLDNADQPPTVVALAASNDGLESLILRLLQMVPQSAANALADCLVQEAIALCPTYITDEEVAYELDTTGQPNSPSNGDGETDAEDNEDNEDVVDVPAEIRGSIALGETVEGSLEATVSDGWIFSDGPAVITIIAQPDSEELDLVIDLYDSLGSLIQQQDGTFGGESEMMSGVTISDDATYTIVVRDFYGAAGNYSLTVTEGDEIGGLFIFADDAGTAQTSGFTDVELFTDAFSERYDVTIWTSSQDGVLQTDDLTGSQIVIWTTGDYVNDNAIESESALSLFSYISSTPGVKLLVFGASPPILQFLTVETGLLEDVIVTNADSSLLSGFEAGSSITLNQPYQTLLIPSDEADEDMGTVLFERGNNSAETGLAVGGLNDDEQNPFFWLALPFSALPADAQTILLDNLQVWMGG